MQLDNITETEAPESRRESLLEAAVGVFARYGFRKTSMDEVARAAGVSRQGLYLHFADKEELFRKAVVYKLARQLEEASAALYDDGRPLEVRLVGACDAWAGRFVGIAGTDAADLMCASTSLAGSTLALYEGQFEQALAGAIASSPLFSVCTLAGFTPENVAHALHATTRGLKQSCRTRQEFLLGITVTAGLFSAAARGIPTPESLND